MPTFLLDTSVIIDAINDRRGPRQASAASTQPQPPTPKVTGSIRRRWPCYPLTWPVSELAGLLKRDYARKGRVLNLDVLIAATALHNRLPLLTDNTRDFPMPALTLHALPR